MDEYATKRETREVLEQRSLNRRGKGEGKGQRQGYEEAWHEMLPSSVQQG